MSKELCKLKKSVLKEDLKAFMRLVNRPTHICTNCGRAANSKKLLGDSIKIQD